MHLKPKFIVEISGTVLGLPPVSRAGYDRVNVFLPVEVPLLYQIEKHKYCQAQS